MSKHQHAKDEMSQGVVSVKSSDHLYHAHAIMRRSGIRHLPVIDQGELVGMLSDRDILRHAVVRNDEVVVGHHLVSDAMTRGTWTCRPEERLGDIAAEMVRRRIDALPVVDNQGNVLGIITSTDFLTYVQRMEGVVDASTVLSDRIERESLPQE